jgi:hypothetical protein
MGENKELTVKVNLGVEDLITLPVLDENSLLENIKSRFSTNLIYVCAACFSSLVTIQIILTLSFFFISNHTQQHITACHSSITRHSLFVSNLLTHSIDMGRNHSDLRESIPIATHLSTRHCSELHQECQSSSSSYLCCC